MRFPSASILQPRGLALLLVVCLFGAPPAGARQSPADSQAETARLLARLRDDDEEERRSAVLALAALPLSLPEINAALQQALDDRSESVRAGAANVLARRGDLSAAPKIAELLREDDSRFVKKEAAYALGQLPAPASVAALVAASRDKNEEVRGAATVGLTALADPSTVPALIERLRDKADFVRQQAARGLGEIGPAARAATPELIRLLQRDRAGEVRREAAAALGRLGDRAALPALEAAARDDDPYLSGAARRAIAAINGGAPAP